MAKKTLLSVAEVRMWWDHLKTVDENRKRGAAKAAATRRRKQESKQASSSVYHCGICGVIFGVSVEDEYWIGCETCDSWFHSDCVNITPQNEPDKFYCSSCAR